MSMFIGLLYGGMMIIFGYAIFKACEQDSAKKIDRYDELMYEFYKNEFKKRK